MSTELPPNSKQSGKPTSPIQLIIGLLLLAPAVGCWITNLVVPTVRTITLSLQKADLLTETEFVGLANYANLFQDGMFASTLSFTVLLVGERLLMVAIVPLLLALAISAFDRTLRLTTRLLFTIPLALAAPPMIALGWGLLLHPNFGLLAGRPWLGSPGTARLAVLGIDALYSFGVACGIGLIVYLAALRGQPEAGPVWKKLRPLIATWVVGVLAAIALTLPLFSLVYLLTRGGPANNTMTLGLLQFVQGFQYFYFGPAAAIATLTLLASAILGLISGLIIILTGLRLEIVPTGHQPVAVFGPTNRSVAILLLILTLPISLGICALSALPLPWIALNSLSLDAYIEVTQQIPLGRVVMNTILPVLATLLLVQLPIAYLSALGIGALRPLGQWSDWLLLPFSPWLFVTVGPLSLVLWQGLRESGQLNTWIALAPPVLVSVPMLFILALFFKGQAPRWQAAQVEGQSAASAFWHQLILPSLPLAALLACITLFIGLQELLWPLLAVTDREYFTINLTLALIQSSFTLDWPVITAALTLFWLPNFIIFFLIFAAFQVLYLGRLALTTSR